MWLEAYDPLEYASITSRSWFSLRAGTGVHATNLDTQGGKVKAGGSKGLGAALAYSELEANLRYIRPRLKLF